jgi:hypothetical protein
MNVGDPDGSRADEIRDLMEQPWYEMSLNEQKLLRGLSADLYSLNKSWSADEEIPPEIGRPLWESVASSRWEYLLESIRLHETSIPPEGVAYFRGIAWFHFGYPKVAAEFLAVSVKADRVLPAYLHYYLYTLIVLDRAEEAMPYAANIVASSADPLLLLDAAEVYFVRSTSVDELQSDVILKMAHEIALRGLAIADTGEKDEILKLQYALTHSWLALYYMRLNDFPAARMSVKIAQQLVPNEPAVLLVDSWLRQKSHSSSWDQGIGKTLVQLRGLQTFGQRQSVVPVALND